MKKTNSRSLAFPRLSERGLTKREYIATQCLQGTISVVPASFYEAIKKFFGLGYRGCEIDIPVNAKRAVSLADALLAELEKKQA